MTMTNKGYLADLAAVANSSGGNENFKFWTTKYINNLERMLSVLGALREYGEDRDIQVAKRLFPRLHTLS